MPVLVCFSAKEAFVVRSSRGDVCLYGQCRIILEENSSSSSSSHQSSKSSNGSFISCQANVFLVFDCLRIMALVEILKLPVMFGGWWSKAGAAACCSWWVMRHWWWWTVDSDERLSIQKANYNFIVISSSNTNFKCFFIECLIRLMLRNSNTPPNDNQVDGAGATRFDTMRINIYLFKSSKNEIDFWLTTKVVPFGCNFVRSVDAVSIKYKWSWSWWLSYMVAEWIGQQQLLLQESLESTSSVYFKCNKWWYQRCLLQ